MTKSLTRSILREVKRFKLIKAVIKKALELDGHTLWGPINSITGKPFYWNTQSKHTCTYGAGVASWLQRPPLIGAGLVRFTVGSVDTKSRKLWFSLPWP